MARYTGLFVVDVDAPIERLRGFLTEILKSCRFDIIYETADYLMAREIPGKVSFSQLVTVEVLIDKPIDPGQEIRMNVVIKNEELPLKRENHCKQMFDSVTRAIADNDKWKDRNNRWQLLETVAG